MVKQAANRRKRRNGRLATIAWNCGQAADGEEGGRQSWGEASHRRKWRVRKQDREKKELLPKLKARKGKKGIGVGSRLELRFRMGITEKGGERRRCPVGEDDSAEKWSALPF